MIQTGVLGMGLPFIASMISEFCIVPAVYSFSVSDNFSLF